DVAQELKAEALPCVRALDEARDVRHDEALVLVHGHDTEVWYQGRERIVGELGARGRDGRDQSGLAGVGVAHQADVRKKFQLQLQPALLAARAGIASGRYAIGRGGEAGVAASTASALRHDRLLAVLGQVGEDLVRLDVFADGADGHADDVGRRRTAVAVAPFAVAAVLRDVVLLELEVEEGGKALGGLQDHVAAVPAVAAVGASMGNVLLPAEAPAPVPTVPRLHVNFDLINKVHSYTKIPSPLEGEGRVRGV